MAHRRPSTSPLLPLRRPLRPPTHRSSSSSRQLRRPLSISRRPPRRPYRPHKCTSPQARALCPHPPCLRHPLRPHPCTSPRPRRLPPPRRCRRSTSRPRCPAGSRRSARARSLRPRSPRPPLCRSRGQRRPRLPQPPPLASSCQVGRTVARIAMAAGHGEGVVEPPGAPIGAPLSCLRPLPPVLWSSALLPQLFTPPSPLAIPIPPQARLCQRRPPSRSLPRRPPARPPT